MTQLTRKVRLLLGFLTLAVSMYNCQPKEVASLTPFTYTFKDLENVKLPDVKPTAPAAVSVTPAQVTSSTAAAAVTSVLSGSATPSAVQSATQTAAQVTQAVPAAKAEAVVATYKPTDIVAAAQSGTVPADLKALAASFAGNPNLQKYLSSFTPPKVNGKTVGGRIGQVEQVAVVLGVTDDIDACKNTANEAYNAAVAGLQTQRQAQTATITATYNAAVTNINTQTTACPNDVRGKYAPQRTAATTAYNQAIAALQAFTAQLPAEERSSVFNGIFVLYTVSYLSAMDAYNSAETAELAACTAYKDALTAAAAAARDADLAQINRNFNSAQTTAQQARDRAVASCHNQGSGK